MELCCSRLMISRNLEIRCIGVSRTSRYVYFAGIITRAILLYTNVEGLPLYIKIEEGGDGYE
jgi:hypothetical protein